MCFMRNSEFAAQIHVVVLNVPIRTGFR